MFHKIQFDVINGTVEVSEFDTEIVDYGFFSDHYRYSDICTILNHHSAIMVGAMTVSDKHFDKIDQEYGIKKLCTPDSYL